MIDIDTLESDVITAILNNKGWKDDDTGYAKIAQLTEYEAFNSYLAWIGVIGYTQRFIDTLDNIREASAQAEWSVIEEQDKKESQKTI